MRPDDRQRQTLWPSRYGLKSWVRYPVMRVMVRTARTVPTQNRNIHLGSRVPNYAPRGREAEHIRPGRISGGLERAPGPSGAPAGTTFSVLYAHFT